MRILDEFALILGVLTLTACSDVALPDTSESPSMSPPSDSRGHRPTQDAASLSWSVHTVKDSLTKEEHSYAVVESLNVVQFEFPYEGEQRATLLYRPLDAGDHIEPLVRLSLEKGQFYCKDPRHCSVRYRLDDGEPSGWRAEVRDDGGTNWIDLGKGHIDDPNSSTCVLLLLTSARKVTIETTFYGQGSRTFEFQVSGLSDLGLGLPSPEQAKICGSA
jgi:hypothetical protein